MENTTQRQNNSTDLGLEWTSQHQAIGIASQTIAVSGFIGNILVAAVMLRPTFWKFNNSIYLLALGLADAGALVFRFISALPVTAKLDFLDNLWVCRMVNWFRYSLHMIASWLLVEVSIERAIVVGRVINAATSSRRGVPIGMTVGTAVVTFIVIGGYVLGDNSSICSVQIIKGMEVGDRIAVIVIGTFIHTVGPALIIIITNIIICVRVYLHFREAIWTHLRRSNTGGTGYQGDNRLTWMLLLNSCGYLLLTVPQIALFVYLSQTDDQFNQSTRQTLQLTFKMLDTVNHSVDPLLYTLSGSLYRSELAKLFRPRSICKAKTNSVV